MSTPARPARNPLAVIPEHRDTDPRNGRDHASRRQRYRSANRTATADLAPVTGHGRISGRGRTVPGTTPSLLAVPNGTVPRSRLDAGGSRLRLRALYAMGHGSARIADAVGVSDKTIRELVRGDARTVSPGLRDAITAVYDAWWDKRAAERTRAEHAAAAAARRRAIAGNWCAGAALDDDLLDIPGYRPRSRWRPATGTGTAPDIHPPARARHQGRHT